MGWGADIGKSGAAWHLADIRSPGLAVWAGGRGVTDCNVRYPTRLFSSSGLDVKLFLDAPAGFTVLAVNGGCNMQAVSIKYV